ncbi:MAG: (2Fe-2S)-binding protein [Rubrobacteraceae bacterium]
MTDGDLLADVQREFVDAGAVQCGYCTPGFLLAVKDFMARYPGASEDEVRTGLVGNICRCTGYTKIVVAALRAAEEGRL